LRRNRPGTQRKGESPRIRGESGRNLEPAKIEYLYNLYMSEVIPARPYVKVEGIDLGIQMAGLVNPAARGLKPADLIDTNVVPELEKDDRCNF
jgi:hypothetical protein